MFVLIMQSLFLLNCHWLVLWMTNLRPYLPSLMPRESLSSKNVDSDPQIKGISMPMHALPLVLQ